MRYFLPLILPALLAACGPPSRPVNTLPSRCEPGYDIIVGRNIGEFELPSGLAYRVVQPGASLAEDYNPERLNIFVDEKGWIQKVKCG